MSRLVTCVLVILVVIAAVPAEAGSWLIGSHLGVSVIKSDVHGSGTSTVVAWPANVFGYQPALRLGFGDSEHAHDLLVDSGLFLIDEAGSTLSLFTALASYQHTFAAAQKDAPFANVGIGLLREGGAAHVSTSTSYGAGAGIRHLVHDGHGALRLEVRAEHLRADDRSGRPALTTVGLRLGFDLWL